jgi:hypothetical protein
MRETPPQPAIVRFALGSLPMGFGSTPPCRRISAAPTPDSAVPFSVPAPRAVSPLRDSAARNHRPAFTAFAALPERPSAA